MGSLINEMIIINTLLILCLAITNINMEQTDALQGSLRDELDPLNGKCSSEEPKACSAVASKEPSSWMARSRSRYNSTSCYRIDVFSFESIAKSDHYNNLDQIRNITTEKETEPQDGFKTQEIVYALENCDWTSLYEVKDTVKAFDEFKSIILRCIQKVQPLKKTNIDMNKNICEFNMQKPSNLALICSNFTKTQTVNDVNYYFATIGEKLASKIMNEIGKTEQDLASSKEIKLNTPNFILEQTTEKEIIDIIDTLKSDSSPGCDYLSKLVVKKAKHILASPIAYLCNLSFFTGIVPDSIKIINIFPVLKSGDPKNPSHYRPISVLTFVSRIIEKVVHRRLNSFLETNYLLTDNQYAFRKGKSKKQAINALVERIITQLDSGKKCIVIFVDLTKAFDTLSRAILLKKMNSIGIREVALDWFKSYFENQTQRVYLGRKTFSEKSDLAPLNFGVCQGSSLGPILFLIYFNDFLKLNLTQAKTFAFADDSALVVHGDTWQMAMDTAQKNLEVIYKWLQDNLMSFNIIKTKFLAFSFSEISAPKIPLSIKIRDCNIKNTTKCKEFVLKRVRSTKFLGVYLDDHLSWKQQMEYLQKKNLELTRIIHTLKKERK